PNAGGAEPLLLGIGVRRAVREGDGRGEKGGRYPAHPSSAVACAVRSTWTCVTETCLRAGEPCGEIVSNLLPGNDVAAIDLGHGVEDPLFLVGRRTALSRRSLGKNVLSGCQSRKITELLREILAVPVKHPNHHG